MEALGGCLASFLGPLLVETVSPFAPFFVSTALATVTWAEKLPKSFRTVHHGSFEVVFPN